MTDSNPVATTVDTTSKLSAIVGEPLKILFIEASQVHFNISPSNARTLHIPFNKCAYSCMRPENHILILLNEFFGTLKELRIMVYIF